MNRLVLILLSWIPVLLCNAAPQAPDNLAVDSLAKTDSLYIALPDSARVYRNRPPRNVTPVDIDDDYRAPVMHYYDKHGDPLDEPVLFLAALDTVTKPKSKPKYPLFNGISAGVNFADAIFQAFGQKYGSYDVWADVSLYNWFFPTIEAGVGFADSTPENRNFTYKVKPSLYLKLGLNYNFLYKSNPDYQVFLGLRAAFSSFGWEATGVNIESSYWQDHQRLELTGLHSTAWWGELLAGIKVKIVSHFSLGWNVRWHFPFKITNATPKNLPAGLSPDALSSPWFIPGYGGSSAFTFSLSAIWTIPVKNDKITKETEQTE